MRIVPLNEVRLSPEQLSYDKSSDSFTLSGVEDSDISGNEQQDVGSDELANEIDRKILTSQYKSDAALREDVIRLFTLWGEKK